MKLAVIHWIRVFSPIQPGVVQWAHLSPSAAVVGTGSLLSQDPAHKAHTNTVWKKSQSVLFKPSPPVWICSLVCGRKTAVVERWRCVFYALVSLSSINFTWTSRHFPTTLCCQHPLCEAGGGEGGTEASRAAEEDREGPGAEYGLHEWPKKRKLSSKRSTRWRLDGAGIRKLDTICMSRSPSWEIREGDYVLQCHVLGDIVVQSCLALAWMHSFCWHYINISRELLSIFDAPL